MTVEEKGEEEKGGSRERVQGEEGETGEGRRGKRVYISHRSGRVLEQFSEKRVHVGGPIFCG